MSAETTTPTAPAMLPATRPEAPDVVLSLNTVQGMEALQRAGNMLSCSSLVPETYRRWTVNKAGERTENPHGLANCVVAMNMATRMQADPLMVMQNLHVIEGRPSWSSVFIIASINQCGRFSPLRFDLSEPGEPSEIEFKYTEWEPNPNNPGKNRPVEKTGKTFVKPQSCRAWAIEKATGERLNGPLVDMKMALDEGWVQKKGSKWRTMQEVMLRYRCASLFGKLYAPELLMGLQSREEVEDYVDAEIIHETPRPSSTPAAPAAASEPGWSVESLEAFDDLKDKAYVEFKSAGMLDHWSVFEDKWLPLRGKANEQETLKGMAEEVAKFTPAPAPVEETPEAPFELAPPPPPTGKKGGKG